jgi:hypothetical protein
MKKTAIIFLSLCFFIGLNGSVFSASSAGQQIKQDRPQLRKEIVKVNYIRAGQAMTLLHFYMSRDGRIRFDDKLGLLTIKDTPEIVGKVLAALKEIDLRPKDLLFTVDLVLASMNKEENDQGLKSDTVMKDLRKVLSYKFYKKIGSSIVRIQDKNHSEHRIGGEGINLRLAMTPRYIKEEKGEMFQLNIDLRHEAVISEAGGEKETKTIRLFETVLTMKNGERTVVGVSKLNGGNNALILILTGKVIK